MPCQNQTLDLIQNQRASPPPPLSLDAGNREVCNKGRTVGFFPYSATLEIVLNPHLPPCLEWGNGGRKGRNTLMIGNVMSWHHTSNAGHIVKEYSLPDVFIVSLDNLCIFGALSHLQFSCCRGCSPRQLIYYHFFLRLCLVIPFALLGRLFVKKKSVLRFSVSDSTSQIWSSGKTHPLIPIQENTYKN